MRKHVEGWFVFLLIFVSGPSCLVVLKGRENIAGGWGGVEDTSCLVFFFKGTPQGKPPCFFGGSPVKKKQHSFRMHSGCPPSSSMSGMLLSWPDFGAEKGTWDRQKPDLSPTG